MIGGGVGAFDRHGAACWDDRAGKELNLKNAKFIYLSPAGKKFNQNDAKRLSGGESLCFICGRYEGIDERIVERYVNEIFCIGDFVLTGGELGALCMCDAISRNIKGVLGNESSLVEESFEGGILEAPAFTKLMFLKIYL